MGVDIFLAESNLILDTGSSGYNKGLYFTCRAVFLDIKGVIHGLREPYNAMISVTVVEHTSSGFNMMVLYC